MSPWDQRILVCSWIVWLHTCFLLGKWEINYKRQTAYSSRHNNSSVFKPNPQIVQGGPSQKPRAEKHFCLLTRRSCSVEQYGKKCCTPTLLHKWQQSQKVPNIFDDKTDTSVMVLCSVFLQALTVNQLPHSYKYFYTTVSTIHKVFRNIMKQIPLLNYFPWFTIN